MFNLATLGNFQLITFRAMLISINTFFMYTFTFFQLIPVAVAAITMQHETNTTLKPTN